MRRSARARAGGGVLGALPEHVRREDAGLTHVRLALERGLHVVTANKGPMVLAYQELHDLAARYGVQLRFDGTVFYRRLPPN